MYLYKISERKCTYYAHTKTIFWGEPPAGNFSSQIIKKEKKRRKHPGCFISHRNQKDAIPVLTAEPEVGNVSLSFASLCIFQY